MEAECAVAEEANLVVDALSEPIGYSLAEEREHAVEMLADCAPELDEGLES